MRFKSSGRLKHGRCVLRISCSVFEARTAATQECATHECATHECATHECAATHDCNTLTTLALRAKNPCGRGRAFKKLVGLLGRFQQSGGKCQAGRSRLVAF